MVNQFSFLRIRVWKRIGTNPFPKGGAFSTSIFQRCQCKCESSGYCCIPVILHFSRTSGIIDTNRLQIKPLYFGENRRSQDVQHRVANKHRPARRHRPQNFRTDLLIGTNQQIGTELKLCLDVQISTELNMRADPQIGTELKIGIDQWIQELSPKSES